MKHPDTRAALVDHQLLPEPDERGEIYGLPELAAPIHALIKQKPDRAGAAERRWQGQLSTQPIHLDPGSADRAICGSFLKVILPMPFNDGDPDVCSRCQAEVADWATDPSAWWARQRRRDDRRRQREDEEIATDLWRASEDQRRALGDSR